MNVFVTDGEHRPALAIVRALGRRGASVIVGAETPTSLASSSKYCTRHVTYPSPQRDRKAFEQFLAEYVAREKVDVVLPVTDVTTHSVCAVQDVLSRYTAVAVPPLEAFDFVSNKGELLERARYCGLSVPQTLCVEGAAGLAAVVDRVRYPAVVKPIRSRFHTAEGWLSATVHYAYSEQELWRLYRTTDVLANHPSLSSGTDHRARHRRIFSL